MKWIDSNNCCAGSREEEKNERTEDRALRRSSDPFMVCPPLRDEPDGDEWSERYVG